MMHIWELYNGMLVTHQGEVARVEKVKQKRLIVQHADGRRYDTWPVHLSPAPADATFTLSVPAAEGVSLGTVVKFRDGRPGMYVVIASENGGTFKISELFGLAGNRYYRNVAATNIKIVERAELADYLTPVNADV